MWQPQFMSRCSHDMTVTRHCVYLRLAQFIIISLLAFEVHGSAFNRQRSKIFSAKKPVEDTTESSKAATDQVALATNNNNRRKDFGYGNFELNLIRPEKEPRLHAQITTKYTTSIIADHTPTSSLEDAETAEEYVSKAMQRFGSRLQEPIRIEPEPEIINAGANPNVGSGSYYEKAPSTEQPNESQQQSEFNAQQPQQEEEARAEYDAQAQALLQQQQNQQQQAQLEYYQAQQSEGVSTEEQQSAEALLGQPAPVYEKDHIVPAYRPYGDESNFESAQPIDRTYRTKLVYQPSYQSANSDTNPNSEKIRVSASTEIPKAEIMKQIEKSVIKYMQELEAEGKIITAPKEPKTYYKMVSVPVEEKRISTTTTRPKYTTPTSTTSYYNTYNGATSPAPYTVEKTTRYHIPKLSYRHQPHSENSPIYQSVPHAQQQETPESLEPNVEFVYKIKSRAPLKTATVKTISKPYTLPLKSAPDQFDHSAVLKSMEEFDLRHVVTSKDIEEQGPATSKPSKLYFNSEIYQDINSLPYKGDKARLVATEYRKIKEPSSQGEYKGYSGYFAEPAPIQTDKEANSNIDDGYPIMNPYQYVLKKEHPSSQFEEISANPSWEQQRIHNKPLFSVGSAQKALEYDDYREKFGNNADSYAFVQAFKSERDREPSHGVHKHVQRHVLGKRGKRGNIHHPNSKKSALRNMHKENGAGIALRPPPKV